MSDPQPTPAAAAPEEKKEKIQRPNQKRRRHNRTKNKNRAPQNVGPFGVGGPKAEPKPKPEKKARRGRKPVVEESKDGQPAPWPRKDRKAKLGPKPQWSANKALYNVGALPAAAPVPAEVASAGTCLERALALSPVAILQDPSRQVASAASDKESKEGQSAMAVPDARTEKGALAYSSTGSACLDLFFGGMLRGADEAKVLGMTANAWQENPSRCLQVIMHARDCRGGKGEKEVVLTAMLWLRINKPRTYLRNIRKFLALGCHRDLVQLAYRAIRLGLAPLGRRDFIELEVIAEDLMADHTKLVAWQKAVEEASAAAASAPADEEKKPRKPKLELTLAAKWAPSEHASFDRKVSLAKRLAKLLFPGQEDSKKGYRTLLTPLRAQLKLVESSMCANEWQDIQFGKVPSRAHHKLKKAFVRHEAERYKKYLEELKQGKEKINTRGLQPHEVVKAYLATETIDETVEAQWRTMVANLQKDGVHLSHVLSMVDVSGSMSGIPMEVAIALGLITSELCGGAFHNQVLTFDSNPTFHTVVGDTLLARVKCLAAAPWGGSTNILAAFDRILETAQQFNVPAADMPSTLFIYSDMQFDQAREPAFQNHATHEIIREKYRAAGYTLPHLVYWNLRPANTSVPTVNEQGVALLSGFSADLLKVFMTNGDFSPEAILTRAITHYSPELDPSEV